MAYAYRQTMNYGWPYTPYQLYIDYNITPAYGTKLYAGDVVEIDGAVRNTGYACSEIWCTWIADMYTDQYTLTASSIQDSVTRNTARTILPISVPKNTTKTFKMTLTVPNIARGQRLTHYDDSTGASEPEIVGDATQIGVWFAVKDGSSPDYPQGLYFDSSNKWLTYVTDKCLPSISNFVLKRHENGVVSDEGIDIMATVKLALSNTIRKAGMHVYLYYEANGTATTESDMLDLTSSMDDLLTGVTNSTTLVTGTYSNGDDFDFMLWFGDQYENTQASVQIIKAFANLHLSGAYRGGVAVGMFSTAEDYEPKFESAFPAYFYGGISCVSNFVEGETDTGGTWIDGEPIYQYVLADYCNISNTQDVVGYLPDPPAALIRVWGYTVHPTAGTFYPIPFTSHATAYSVGATVLPDGGIRLNYGSGWTGDRYFAIIVEYTKASI